MRKPGAASFSVGMPNYAAIYALNAALRYLEQIKVANITTHADPLVSQLETGLRELNLTPLAAQRAGNASGILAIRHDRADAIHATLEAAEVHVMNHAGRLRMALHGYNTTADVEKFRGAEGRAVDYKFNGAKSLSSLAIASTRSPPLERATLQHRPRLVQPFHLAQVTGDIIWNQPFLRKPFHAGRQQLAAASMLPPAHRREAYA